MRRTVVLLASMALVMLLASGVALAATINCPNRAGNLCVGTDNRDFMYGTSAKDVIRGLGAADTLRARAGADRLSGGDGGDKLGGGRGSDVYAFRDEWGRDLITSRESSGVDTLDFTGLNRDFVSVELFAESWTAEVQASHGSGKTAFINFPNGVVLENVRGTPQGDNIEGNDSPNHLWGYPGGDLLIGGLSNDVLDGGAGKDDLYSYGYVQGDDGSDSTLTGGPGTDLLYGEDGDDTIHAIDGEVDRIVCGDGIDTVHYDQGLDTFYSSTTPDGPAYSTSPPPSCETTLTT